jgi:arsenate reductase-like glutaredoxin family protein
MPDCAFCGGRVLPANMVKGDKVLGHPVCDKCRLILDEYMESRAVDYMQSQVQEMLPEMLEETLAKWEGRAFVVKFEDKWNRQLEGKVKEVIAEALADLVKEEVAGALKGGLASLMSGARPLARGKKHSDSKTSPVGV